MDPPARGDAHPLIFWSAPRTIILATVLVPVVVFSAALVIVSAALLVRALVTRRYDREGQARLAVGPDGIIPGAGPIDLPVAGNGRAPAALLLHGFGDTPQTLAYLAASLRGTSWRRCDGRTSRWRSLVCPWAVR